jgi:hypothetical protein
MASHGGPAALVWRAILATLGRGLQMFPDFIKCMVKLRGIIIVMAGMRMRPSTLVVLLPESDDESRKA